MLIILLTGGGSAVYPGARFAGQCFGIAMLVAAIIAGNGNPAAGPRRMRAPDWLVLAIVLLTVIQLIPLPPGIWTSLAGRELYAEGDRLVFADLPWRPLSLDPPETMRALLFLIAPVSAYIAMRSGNAARRKAILLACMAAFGIALLLGLVQLAADGSPVVYDTRHASAPKGFFANRNHQASFLVMGLVVATFVWLQRFSTRSEAARPGIAPARWQWPAMAALGAVSFVAIAGTGSRTGIAIAVLIVPAAALTCYMALEPNMKGGAAPVPRRAAIFTATGTAIAAALIGVARLIFADDRATLESFGRERIWPASFDAMRDLFPWGSGFGTFRYTYERYEPTSIVNPLYTNAAHSDWLQLAFEAGLPGLTLALLAFVCVVRTTRRAIQHATGARRALVLLPVLALAVPALHSVTDYPMRTHAVAVLTAVLFALIAAPPVENRAAMGKKNWLDL